MNYKRGSIWTTSLQESDRQHWVPGRLLSLICHHSKTVFSAFQVYHMHPLLPQSLSPGCSPFLKHLSPLSFLLPRLLHNIEYTSLCCTVGSFLADLCSYVRWQSFPGGSDDKEVVSFFKATFYDLLCLHRVRFFHLSIYTLVSFFIKLLITQVKIYLVYGVLTVCQILS